MVGENGKIDYGKLKPILFEMPTYPYLRTGEVVAYPAQILFVSPEECQ